MKYLEIIYKVKVSALTFHKLDIEWWSGVISKYIEGQQWNGPYISLNIRWAVIDDMVYQEQFFSNKLHFFVVLYSTTEIQCQGETIEILLWKMILKSLPEIVQQQCCTENSWSGIICNRFVAHFLPKVRYPKMYTSVC